jgi:hypothetical protein
MDESDTKDSDGDVDEVELDFDPSIEELANKSFITLDAYELNQQVLFSKLDRIPKIDNVYVRCNDLIDVVSDAKIRDKRLINDYGSDLVIIKKIKVKGVLRECRCFTRMGLETYIHNGKLYDYKNVCAYYQVTMKDFIADELKSLVVEEEDDEVYFNTKQILKWLFEKRKSDKSLGDKISMTDLREWIKNHNTRDANEKKKQSIANW